MTAIERVVFVAEMPGERRIARTLPPILEWVSDMLFAHGHCDGFEVRLSVQLMGGELPEDTEWLERELGRE